jgi:uncharacterized protein with von Willebrand factor type A (vWA) domain
MSTPLLLRGVDLAAFAAALVARLRGTGVSVSASGQATFVQALRRLVPHTRTALYWAARLTLVNRMEDLGAFDAVFNSVFGTAQPDGASDATLPLPGPRTPAAGIVHRTGGPSGAAGQALPWATRAVTDQNDSTIPSIQLRDVLPAASPHGPTNRSTASIPTTCACSAPGWRPRWRAGPGGAPCALSPARTASASTCGRR